MMTLEMENMDIKDILASLIVVIAVSFITPLHAQEQPALRDRAEEFYRRYEYARAAAAYAKLVDRKEPRLDDMERLAHCYLEMNDYESAETWYARVVGHGESDVENLLGYADVLKASGRYAEARKQYKQYATQASDASAVAVAIAGCDSAMVWMAEPTPHNLRNESEVNTERSEFSAYPIEDSVYFVGEPDMELSKREYGRTGNAFLQVFTAGRSADNKVSSPAIASSHINNGNYHVGPVAAGEGGNTLFVTRTYPGRDGSHTKEDRRRYRTNKLELYIYTRAGDGWEMVPFPYNNIKDYSVGHAALNGDGQTLYFTSDMPGGHGGSDIWYSGRQSDGSWGSPVNAGNAINSTGDEMFPNIGPDGALYYSTDGFAGLGGLDIFRSRGSRSAWSRPENLRFPVNSAGDDFAYIATDDETESVSGYLSSNRKGGRGGDDIYSFRMEKPKIVIILKGTTSDKRTGERLPATTVALYDGHREIIVKENSDGAGTFEFVLDREQQYTVLGHRNGYHADSAKVNTMGIVKSDTLEVALLLEPVFEAGQTFELENIYYDFDKHNIRPDAALVLDELVRTIRDNPTLKIELSSHTDSRGSDTYNEALSQRRAQAAVDYLVSKGIARDRMGAKGYGESRLVNDCGNGATCSREQHQANRRTEVTVLEY